MQKLQQSLVLPVRVQRRDEAFQINRFCSVLT